MADSGVADADSNALTLTDTRIASQLLLTFATFAKSPLPPLPLLPSPVKVAKVKDLPLPLPGLGKGKSNLYPMQTLCLIAGMAGCCHSCHSDPPTSGCLLQSNQFRKQDEIIEFSLQLALACASSV